MKRRYAAYMHTFSYDLTNSEKNAVVPLATLPENLVPFTMGGDIWRQFSYLGLHLEHLESWLQLSKAPLF